MVYEPTLSPPSPSSLVAFGQMLEEFQKEFKKTLAPFHKSLSTLKSRIGKLEERRGIPSPTEDPSTGNYVDLCKNFYPGSCVLESPLNNFCSRSTCISIDVGPSFSQELGSKLTSDMPPDVMSLVPCFKTDSKWVTDMDFLDSTFLGSVEELLKIDGEMETKPAVESVFQQLTEDLRPCLASFFDSKLLGSIEVYSSLVLHVAGMLTATVKIDFELASPIEDTWVRVTAMPFVRSSGLVLAAHKSKLAFFGCLLQDSCIPHRRPPPKPPPSTRAFLSCTSFVRCNSFSCIPFDGCGTLVLSSFAIHLFDELYNRTVVIWIFEAFVLSCFYCEYVAWNALLLPSFIMWMHHMLPTAQSTYSYITILFSRQLYKWSIYMFTSCHPNHHLPCPAKVYTGQQKLRG